MTVELLPNIPRIYTALAETLACLTFILVLTKRKHWLLTYLFMALGQFLLHVLVSSWPLTFWIGGMILNVCWMFLTIFFTCKINIKQASYISAKAFIIAEFIASFAWQFYCNILLNTTYDSPQVTAIFMIVLYLLLLAVFHLIELKMKSDDLLAYIRKKDVLMVILTAIIIFSISNIGFITSPLSFFSDNSITIFLTRTLINLSGICILYMQEKQKTETYLKRELLAIHNMFQGQYEQYMAYKESNSIINRKFHDLKYQIEIIRLEKNDEKKEAYLAQMSQVISDFSANIETGNGILNTILTQKNQFCIAHDIQLTCIVDGKLLDFFSTMDICSLFGNALDNAIESVLKIENKEQRLINLRVFSRGEFVMISLENYYHDTIEFHEGLPVTTKNDHDYHGYGIKSIAYLTDKYAGNMTINSDNHWFSLKLLFPNQKSMTTA